MCIRDRNTTAPNAQSSALGVLCRQARIFCIGFFTSVLRQLGHKDDVAVGSAQQLHIAEDAFLHKAGLLIAAAGGGVFGQHAQADAVQMQPRKAMQEARRMVDERPDLLSLQEMYKVAGSYEKGSVDYKRVMDAENFLLFLDLCRGDIM